MKVTLPGSLTAGILLLWACTGPAPADDDDSAAASDDDDSGSTSDDDDSGISSDDDDSAPAPLRPNILLLIADDFGLDVAAFDRDAPCFDFGDVSEQPRMPNLAALCEDGLRFTRAWSMPTCSPTRASMLTGQWPHQTGVGSALGTDNHLDLTSWTLPRALAGAGSDYDTASVGKWHLSSGAGDPNTAGWPSYVGSIPAVQNYFAWLRTVDGTTSLSTDYVTSANTDDALAWLGERGDSPWFLWLAFSTPHTPFHVPPPELYDGPALAEYDEDSDDDPYPWFVAMNEALDAELGRLFDGLRTSGEWDDTIVVFLGDNGTTRAVIQPPFRGIRSKGSLGEGGIAVPLVVAGPGVASGASTTALVSVVDVFATVLELAGLDVEAERQTQVPDVVLDSTSFVPLLDGSEEATRQWMLAEAFGGPGADPIDGRAIRDDSYKLVCLVDGTVELFDMDEDRFEHDDLYTEGVGPDAGHEAAYESLRDLLREAVGEASWCE